MVDEDISVCEECGSSVYKEHIVSGIAKEVEGHLLCAHCLKERGGSGDGLDDFDDLAPIEFDDEEDDEGSKVDMTSTRITAMGDLGAGKAKDEKQFKRSLDPTSSGGSRCRVFHCRISQGAIDFVTNQMNDWLDENDDITVKFATTTIGMFEGKHTEPNLITTVFY